jgi:hypothetical protein
MCEFSPTQPSTGYCCNPNNKEDWDALEAAEKDGILIRASEVHECNKMMLNPYYTFVTNDERGHQMAREEAIDTIVM